MKIKSPRGIGIVVCVAALLAGAATLGAAGCSCAPVDVSTMLKQADAVFAGRVIGLELVPRLNADPTVSHATEDLQVKVAVSSCWKGIVRVETTLYTMFTCCLCGFHFEIGEMYLIYAESVDGELRTSICSRTRLLSDASDDLVVLGVSRPILRTEPEACQEEKQ